MGMYITYEERLRLCTKIEFLFRKNNLSSSIFTEAFRIRYLSNYFGIICFLESLYLTTSDDDLTKKLNKDAEKFLGFVKNFSIVILKVQSSLLSASEDQVEKVVEPISIVTRFSSGLSYADSTSRNIRDILAPRTVFRNVLEFDLEDIPFSQEVFDLLTALHHC